jgi:hypothetical protein
LLESGKLETAEDFHDAAFIYQHGQKPDDYLLAHVLAMVAVQKGDAKSSGFPPQRWTATFKRLDNRRCLGLSTAIMVIRPTRGSHTIAI